MNIQAMMKQAQKLQKDMVSEKNKIGRLYHALPFSKYVDKGIA